MNRYRIIWIGRRSRDPLHEAADDYLGRLQRYARVDMIHLKDSTKEKEGNAILALLPPGERVVALDERGQPLTTMTMAHTLNAWMHGGKTQTTLVIGGADGLDARVVQRADALWALSALTLPHRLALVVLLEQLYRSHTILKQEPYHRV